MAIIPGSAKVLNQYENVNTTYGGSKAMKAQSKWYTMDDVIETINANPPAAPYKVFTALVSQISGDNPVNIGAESPMLLGVTYIINDNSNDVDLTVFGAPNSNIGTSFICTTAGTLPDDSGLALSYNIGAPVVSILENTIGNIWFTFYGDGSYYILSDDLFTQGKTFINGTSFINYSAFNPLIDLSSFEAGLKRGYFFEIPGGIENQISLYTLKDIGSVGNGIIENPICIEIRVYN
jgi:hypothetical protein